MAAMTFTDQDLRALASRLKVAHGGLGGDLDSYNASHAIEFLMRERGALTARLECVTRAIHNVTHDTDGGEVDGNLPAEEVRRVLHEALDEVAW